MGLDEAFAHKQIRLCCHFINKERRAGREYPHIYHGVHILAVMHHDMFSIHNFLSKFANKFFSGRCSVKSCGDQQCDLRVRITFPDFF